VGAVAHYRKIDLRGVRRGLLTLRALSGTISLVMVFYAYTRMSTAAAMLLNQMAPVFMVPLAVVFLKERTSAVHIALVLVAFAGVGLVLKPDFRQLNTPGLLALLSAFFAAVAYLLVRRLTATEHPLTIVFWFSTLSALFVLPWVFDELLLSSGRALMLVLLVGLLGAAGQVLLTEGYRLGEAGKLAVVGSMASIFCVLWDWLLFNLLPDLWTAAGGMIVIVSCAAIQVLRHERSDRIGT